MQNSSDKAVQNSVEVEDLRKTFMLTKRQGLRHITSSVAAVNGISFVIPTGQSVAFIGPNGAGKSTTIKMLTGILHPSSGRAQVLGLTPWRDRERLAFNIASVFGQKSQLWIHLPPLDTFNLLARIYELDERAYKERINYLIEVFEIG